MGNVVGKDGPTLPSAGVLGRCPEESGEKEQAKSWSLEYQTNVEGQNKQALMTWVRRHCIKSSGRVTGSDLSPLRLAGTCICGCGADKAG